MTSAGRYNTFLEKAEDFQYTSLHTRDAIRLVTLHPSSDRNSLICCSIRETTLEECHHDTIDHFTAVSYVWGDRDDRTTISLNGAKFEVTKSLWEALRDIRDESRGRLMWIDAICINQVDNLEKSMQVAEMWNVYHTADHTLIYLGPTPSYWHKWAGWMRKRKQIGIPYKTLESSYTEVEHFMTHQWFRRVWCFQELVFSRDPWLQCGSTAIRWSNVGRLITNVLVGATVPSSIVFSTMQNNRERVQEEVIGRSTSPSSSLNAMKELLVARRAMGVTDPRDMVFAHLGIAGVHHAIGEDENYNSCIKPDYGISTRTLYERLMAHLLNHGHYEMFAMTERRIDFEYRKRELSSWAVDWTAQSTTLYKPFSSSYISKQAPFPFTGYWSGSCGLDVITSTSKSSVLTSFPTLPQKRSTTTPRLATRGWLLVMGIIGSREEDSGRLGGEKRKRRRRRNLKQNALRGFVRPPLSDGSCFVFLAN
jgi:hypothetical protein